jgi:hypothetical protein
MDIFKHIATSKLSLNSLRVWLYIYSNLYADINCDLALLDYSLCCEDLKLSSDSLNKILLDLQKKDFIRIDYDCIHPFCYEIQLLHLPLLTISEESYQALKATKKTPHN